MVSYYTGIWYINVLPIGAYNKFLVYITENVCSALNTQWQWQAETNGNIWEVKNLGFISFYFADV